MLPGFLKLALDRLRGAFLALLSQTLGKSEQCTTVTRLAQDLSAKNFFCTGVITVRQQHTTEHFTYWKIPVSRFGVIRCIFSGDGTGQKIDASLFVAASKRDLAFEL